MDEWAPPCPTVQWHAGIGSRSQSWNAHKGGNTPCDRGGVMASSHPAQSPLIVAVEPDPLQARRVAEVLQRAFDADVVLAVFAHPDDESLAVGGTLARLASEGYHVVVMCASHGERGSEVGPVRDDALGRIRATELMTAARTLGIAEVILWHHPDGDLRWAEVTDFHAELILFLRRRRPSAVITFDEDGLYWHADHIGVYERVLTAVQSLGPEAPPLYLATMARGRMPAIVNTAKSRGWVAPAKGFWSLVPEAFGLAAEIGRAHV